MPTITTPNTGIELFYEEHGDPAAPVMLLVMGLGGPMTWWDADLCRELAAAGFYVIRYDNRDTGRSSRGTGRVRRADLARAFVGAPARAPLPENIFTNHSNFPKQCKAENKNVLYGTHFMRSVVYRSHAFYAFLKHFMRSCGYMMRPAT